MRLAAFALATLPSVALLGACSPISSPTGARRGVASTAFTRMGSTTGNRIRGRSTSRILVFTDMADKSVPTAVKPSVPIKNTRNR